MGCHHLSGKSVLNLFFIIVVINMLNGNGMVCSMKLSCCSEQHPIVEIKIIMRLKRLDLEERGLKCPG